MNLKERQKKSMKADIQDRIISIISYFTFGFFSIIWIIIANVFRKPISSFLGFNLYQAIFISIVLAILSLVYSIALGLMGAIPIIGNIARAFDIFFNQTPIYYTFTLSGLCVTMLLCYVSIMSLLGFKAYIPAISDIIEQNFRI